MPAYGYPDWSRSQSGISTPIVQDALFPPTGGKDYGATYVGNWPYLSIYVNNLDSIAQNQLNLTWATTNIGNFVTGSNAAVWNPIQGGNWLVPVRAPWLDPKLSSSVTPTHNLTSFVIYGTSTSAKPPPDSPPTSLLQQGFIAYTANSVQTFPIPGWFAGEAYITAFSDLGGAAWCEVQAWDISSQAYKSAQSVGVQINTSAVVTKIGLQPMPHRVLVHNGGTAQQIAVEIVASV